MNSVKRFRVSSVKVPSCPSRCRLQSEGNLNIFKFFFYLPSLCYHYYYYMLLSWRQTGAHTNYSKKTDAIVCSKPLTNITQIFVHFYADPIRFFGAWSQPDTGWKRASAKSHCLPSTITNTQGVHCRLTPCCRSFCVPSGLSWRRGGATEEEPPVGDCRSSGYRFPAGTSATLLCKVRCVQQILTSAAAPGGSVCSSRAAVIVVVRTCVFQPTWSTRLEANIYRWRQSHRAVKKKKKVKDLLGLQMFCFFNMMMVFYFFIFF